jgi:hypothetical protein
MRLHTTLAALVLAAAPAIAQETQDTQGGASEADLRQAAEGYIDSQAMQTALDELLSTDTFVAQLEASGMRLDPEQTRTLAGIVDEEFADVRPALEEAMTVAAADAFTMEELEALATSTEARRGGRSPTKMTPFMQSFYERDRPDPARDPAGRSPCARRRR